MIDKELLQSIIQQIQSQATRLCWDSRTLQPNDIFVALKTASNDGHHYLTQALQAKAQAAIVEQIHPKIPLKQILVDNTWNAIHQIAAAYRDHFTGTIIGATGSCGKTSSKDLLALLLGNNTSKTLKNENNLLGMPKTLLQIRPEQDRFCVVEAGINEPHEMAKLAETLRPDHAIITSIEPVHLEKLLNTDTIAREKSLLFQHTKPNGLKIIPKKYRHYRVFQQNDIISPEDHITRSASQTTLTIKGIGTFDLPHYSDGMLSNASLCIYMAHYLGVCTKDIQERVLQWAPSDHRGQIIEKNGIQIYADCYNSNPTALLDAQKHFRYIFNSQASLYIIGSMGELGNDSQTLHKNAITSMTFNQEDYFILYGEMAATMQEALLEKNIPKDQINIEQDLNKIKERIQSSKIPIFIKGSNSCRFQELLS